MQPRPCPNLAEVVAVLHLNLVGAKRMMKIIVYTLTVVSRWLIPCANQSHVSVVITVNIITNIYYLYDTNK